MELSKAFEAAGLRPRKPLAAKRRQQLFSQLAGQIPSQVEVLYEQCDGGRIPALSCRFYPLEEAVKAAGGFAWRAGFRFLPFFESANNLSDPCMVGLEPPLSGYVFQLCHDLANRVLAPSIPAFLKSLASQPPDLGFCIEDATFVYPKALSKAEQKTVAGLLERSRTDLQIEYEAALLVELALSMVTDEECVHVLGDADHPDHNARFTIAARLREIGTPAAKQLLDQAEEGLRRFVQEAIRVLSEAGFDATTEHGTDLRIAGQGVNVGAFYDRRGRPDCWEHLLERVRALFGAKAPSRASKPAPAPKGRRQRVARTQTPSTQAPSGMAIDFTKAFEACGFRPRKPLEEKARQRLLSRLDGEMPPELEAFYAQCNGGRIAAFGWDFCPLAEAVDLAEAFDYATSLRFLPFLMPEEDGEPCTVGLEAPLSGYVFDLFNGPTRILAPSVSSFLEFLASHPPDGDVYIDEMTFVYPRALSEAEWQTVGELMARSLSEPVTETDPLVFVDLALSMLTDAECLRVLSGWDHPDPHARFAASDRLRRIDTPEAAKLRDQLQPELRAFAEEAVRVLTKAGLKATAEGGANIRVVGRKELKLNIGAFLGLRGTPGCWDALLNWVNSLEGG